jgi:intraflagellar transport protein 81
MMDFLRALNFKPPVDMAHYQQALLQGDPQAIHPMLAWMLVRLPELKKRAYLSRFLSPVEVPEGMLADEEMAQLAAHLQGLQAEFKEQHKCAQAHTPQL